MSRPVKYGEDWGGVGEGLGENEPKEGARLVQYELETQRAPL